MSEAFQTAGANSPGGSISSEDRARVETTSLEEDQFDEEYYKNRHPDIAKAIADGRLKSGWAHYQRSGFREGRDARNKLIGADASEDRLSADKSLFDEEYYRNRHPDIAKAISDGRLVSGWFHYQQIGRREGRDVRLRVNGLEAVRLVVWDLDETYWKGTASEGGIKEHIQQHHDIVIELARRGIMSSICSKNDEATILKILTERGIGEYFIFPSISWTPKGARLAELIEAVQLRPATVMFIHDNPNNRAEAIASVPDLQVEDETFISKMLLDPRFKGKADEQLTRLAQHKLVETRKRDEMRASGDNEDFLRRCDIRVFIEYDVDANIDRAVELITRTNQLNFTKRPLPGNEEEARNLLKSELSYFDRQAGLIRVVDKYGDYGFVGFFVTEALRERYVPGAAHRTLRHFCFSCRTLGMFVEQWVYEYLGRPQLNVVGDVLTDPSALRSLDWIRLASSISGDSVPCEKVAPEIRVYGGCEANAIGVYLKAYAEKLDVLENFMAGALFVRINSAPLALSMFSRNSEDLRTEAEALGLPPDLASSDFLSRAAPGSAFVFNCGRDAGDAHRYRHKSRGWEIMLEVMGSPEIDLHAVGEEELRLRLEAQHRFNDEYLRQIYRTAAHIRTQYERVKDVSDEQRLSNMRALIERIPVGSKLVILLDHDVTRAADGSLINAKFVSKYNSLIASLAKEFPYVATVSFSEVLENDSQIQVGGNHYDRVIYVNITQRILEAIRRLSPKAKVTKEAQRRRSRKVKGGLSELWTRILPGK
jgi:FkbH-like protein